MAITVILGSIASAILYRCGGVGKPYDTKYRDWGCSLITLITICLLNTKLVVISNWLVFTISFLLSWGALSTYWKKSADAKWINWFFHGFGIGLSSIPFAWIGIAWWLILIRAVVLGITMMLVSEWNDNPVWEECGRGALIVLTLPILFI